MVCVLRVSVSSRDLPDGQKPIHYIGAVFIGAVFDDLYVHLSREVP
jgi:hypothetical protein